MALRSNLTDDQKQEFVRRAISGENYSILSNEAGVSTRTITTWRRKWEHLFSDEDTSIAKTSRLRSWRDENGNYQAEWITRKKEEDDLRKVQEAFLKGLMSEIQPQDPVFFNNKSNQDLLSLYVISDHHVGMLAWEQEGGDNWDLDIAERTLVNWFKFAIDSAPDSAVGVLAELGDFMHFDSLESKTPASGHILDADSRLPKIVEMVARVLRQIINMMLEKHERVHFIPCEGNHNEASSVWVRAMFKVLYENEPRVTIDNTHVPYYCYEFGKVSLFFHHGHKKRMAQISEVFAGMFRDVFGRTEHSYAHMGHLHHKEVKENAMMIVEQHQTLAAKDAYAARGGYLSSRSASCITYHKKYGEVGRVTITPDMIQ